MNKKLEDTFDLPNIEDMIAEQESAKENQQETSDKEEIEAVEETVEQSVNQVEETKQEQPRDENGRFSKYENEFIFTLFPILTLGPKTT